MDIAEIALGWAVDQGKRAPYVLAKPGGDAAGRKDGDPC
jgi:hypothetical protein